MRYFTKEIYEKMQVSGYLHVVPHLYEQSDEWKEWYLTQGRDFRTEVQQQFLQLKPLFLKYIPEFRVSTIFAQYIAETEERTEEMSGFINQWAQDYEKAWEEACRSNQEEYLKIRGTLPKSFTTMRENHDLHDARIISVNWREDSSIVVQLDGKSSLGLCGTGYLTFEEVKSYEIPKGNWWLYDEVHLTTDGYMDFRVLLHDNSVTSEKLVPLHEMRIVANGFSFELEMFPETEL